MGSWQGALEIIPILLGWPMELLTTLLGEGKQKSHEPWGKLLPCSPFCHVLKDLPGKKRIHPSTTGKHTHPTSQPATSPAGIWVVSSSFPICQSSFRHFKFQPQFPNRQALLFYQALLLADWVQSQNKVRNRKWPYIFISSCNLWLSGKYGWKTWWTLKQSQLSQISQEVLAPSIS